MMTYGWMKKWVHNDDGWMKKWVHNDDRWMDEEVRGSEIMKVDG
jgi:hypothetical protein